MVFNNFFEWAQQYVIEAQYFAVFAVNAVASSTIFIGIPGLSYFIILFSVSLGLHPLLIGILAGLGSATGELTGYMIGFGSTATIEKYEHKIPRILKRLMKLFKNVGFWLILIVSFIPGIPFDVVGILAGAAQYNLKRFYLATIIGKTLRSLIIAYAAYFAYSSVQSFFAVLW